MNERSVFPALADMWAQFVAPWIDTYLTCDVAVAIETEPDECSSSRFAYLSLLSDLEDLERYRRRWYDLADNCARMDETDAFRKLQSGSVAALVTLPNRHEPPQSMNIRPDMRSQMNGLRLARLNVRNMLLEIGLQAVQLGPSHDLMAQVVSRWDPYLATSLDLGTELAQGAARQRFVDDQFQLVAPKRLRAAEEALASQDVRSNRILVL